MCLVSYIPMEDGWVLTSNRDESPSRADTQLVKEEIKGNKIVYPRDIAGGSWLFASSRGRAACLLNGAFEIHHRQLPYRMSRGLLIKELFSYYTFKDWVSNTDFSGIEPFTLIVIEGVRLYELRWDESIKSIELLDAKLNHVWSSCTLYTYEMQEKREREFRDMLRKVESPTTALVKQVHEEGKVDDPFNDFVMNREERVKTISISSVSMHNNAIIMNYHDLENEKKSNITLDLT